MRAIVPERRESVNRALRSPFVRTALLDEAFFSRDAVVVGRDLLGRWLVRDDVVVRVTEVEAYRHPNDSASHCRMGRTARNAPMWGPPGRAYVYLCYGVHSMLNLVTNPVGEGAAVLIRSVEAIEGRPTIEARRGRRVGARDLAGPGKVAQALGLDVSWSHHSVIERSGLECRAGDPVARALVGPRVGIEYANARDRRAPYRFADPASTSVTERSTLRLERERRA